jgi:hypothetical protein
MVKFMGSKALVGLLLACVAIGLTAVALHTSARGNTELVSFGGAFSKWYAPSHTGFRRWAGGCRPR